MKYLVGSAALDRLTWCLDGLAGQPGWDADATQVLAPQLTARTPVDRFLELTRQRSRNDAPLSVVGVESADHTARARILDHQGGVAVATWSRAGRPAG